jgi:acylphosphatase
MSDLAALQAKVYGLVQGVFFRAFAREQATKLGLTGYVRNLVAEEAVEVWAEGDRAKLETLIGYLKMGPPRAKVTKVITDWSQYTGDYSGFGIRY